jgi:hypothetical protein
VGPTPNVRCGVIGGNWQAPCPCPLPLVKRGHVGSPGTSPLYPQQQTFHIGSFCELKPRQLRKFSACRTRSTQPRHIRREHRSAFSSTCLRWLLLDFLLSLGAHIVHTPTSNYLKKLNSRSNPSWEVWARSSQRNLARRLVCCADQLNAPPKSGSSSPRGWCRYQDAISECRAVWASCRPDLVEALTSGNSVVDLICSMVNIDDTSWRSILAISR